MGRGGRELGGDQRREAPLARDELVEVVRRLEAGGATLEESLALWERGEQLAQVCQGWLDGAKARLDEALGERAPATGS